MIKKVIVFAFFFALMGPCSGFSIDSFSAHVLAVKDGDTLDVNLDNADVSPIRIRLAHIDAPEKSQPFGKKAKAVLASLCADKDVIVTILTRDRYGRYVGVVSVDQCNVNLEMVKLGYAWWYSHYSKDLSYKEAEMKAKERKIGLWSIPNPIPPWIFRKEQRAHASST